MKEIKFLLLILEFNLFYMQTRNELNYLICGAGTYNPPTLLEYDNTIPKQSEFSPIRIFIYYTLLDECFLNSEYTNIAKSKNLIKKSLSKAANLMEQIIKIQRYSQNIHLTEDMITSLNLESYSQTLLTGIPYDLIVFPRILQKTTVHLYSEERIINFYGYPKVVDKSTKRPIFGYLNIYNLDYTTMSNLETYFINSFIHQLMHIMVFDPNLIKNFPNYNSPQYVHKIDISQAYSNFIISPKVLSFAKRHYNCSNIDGMKLDFSTKLFVTDESNVLYHWDQRYMLGDIMTLEYYEEQTISEITLALFEDSNWYQVNYYTGGLFRYGKGETCIFIKFKCVNDYFVYSAFCPEDKEDQYRCTASRLQKGVCRFYTYSSPLSEYFQYYPNNHTKGGKPTVQYCPVAQKQYSSNQYIYNFAPGSCVNGLNTSGLAESVSKNSFCAVSSVVPSGGNYYLNFARAACYPMFCTETSLTIQIGNLFLVCPKFGGVVNGFQNYGYYGNVECPDYNYICTGSVMCNNIQDCIEKKSVYKENTFFYDGLTHIYQDLTSSLNDNIKNSGENSENGKCGINCIFCNTDNSCLKCREDGGTYKKGSKIIDRNNNHYLFCDLIQNFRSDEFKLDDNGIYYPFVNLIEPTTISNEESSTKQTNLNGQENEDYNQEKEDNEQNNNNIGNNSKYFVDINNYCLLIILLYFL